MNWKNVAVVALAFIAAKMADRYLGVSRLFSAAA
jgi:hypothetical protein